jgi:predicted amidohydrolase YtcJ
MRPSPLLSIHAAMTRTDADGNVVPGEPAGFADALAMVTRSAAFAAFAEDRAGRIAPGLPADLVLLDQLPDGGVPPSVWWTLIGGRAGFVAGDAPPYPVGMQ